MVDLRLPTRRCPLAEGVLRRGVVVRGLSFFQFEPADMESVIID